MNKQALKVYSTLAERRASVAKYDRRNAYMRYIAPLYARGAPDNYGDKDAAIAYFSFAL